MSNLVTVKTNFTSGQVSPRLYSRGDLKVYANGAKKLENIRIFPTGGVSRRFGLRYIDEVAQNSRLIAFEFNTEQVYLLCFSPNKLKVYKNTSCVAELDTPWNEQQLKKINWTQSADTLLVVHPDVPPKQISRNDGEIWKISDWGFYTSMGHVSCPYYNFYNKLVTVTPSGVNGNITLTASQDIFVPSLVNSRIRINGGEGICTSVIDAKKATMVVHKALTTGAATVDWDEQVFCERRGYPSSVTFHQDRMVIGGSRSLPNHLWLSKSSDLFNFDIGTGKDDEAIDFAILSDQVNTITNVVSTRHLLVFTTGAEWMVSGQPLTPASIQLNRQTNVGSYKHYSIVPQNVDGATLFISQSGTQLREFLYADVEQAYQAKDLTLLSDDILCSPLDMAYHQEASQLYIVLNDGTISCLTTYRTEDVNAWSKLSTEGMFESVAVIGDDVYFAVKRGGKWSLEVLDSGVYADCAKILTSEVPQKHWDGLDYLEGKTVSIVADGYTVGQFKVEKGAVDLHENALKIIVGLPYNHIIEPLAFMADGILPYSPRALRVVNGVFRLLETQTMNINFGNGFCEVPLKRSQRNAISDVPTAVYTGDVELRSLGWIRDLSNPLWIIKSGRPSPFTLLGAVLEVKIKQ